MRQTTINGKRLQKDPQHDQNQNISYVELGTNISNRSKIPNDIINDSCSPMNDNIGDEEEEL